MGILIAFLIVVEVLVSVLLIGLVLLQKSREQGLGMAFGANVGESLFGSRAGNVLTKGTVLLGIIFAANTLLLGVLYAGRSESLVEEKLGGETAVQTAPATLPEGAGTLSPDTGAAVAPGTVDLPTTAPAPEAAPETPASEAAPAPETPVDPVPDAPPAP
jgi:preprotein translocase subunit SecG